MSLDPTKIDPELEVRVVWLGSLKGTALCAVILAVGYFFLLRFFSFPQGAFTLQVDVFVLLWVLIGVGAYRVLGAIPKRTLQARPLALRPEG